MALLYDAECRNELLGNDIHCRCCLHVGVDGTILLVTQTTNGFSSSFAHYVANATMFSSNCLTLRELQLEIYRQETGASA